MAPQVWSVYVIRCADGSLYTGITTDIERRLAEHRSGEGRGARYVRSRGPLELVLEREIGDRGAALRVEHRIKRLDRAEKEGLLTRPGALDELFDPPATRR